MASFKYQAVNQAGQVVRGRIDANNRQDLERRVGRLGLSLISATESGSRFGNVSLFQKKVTRDELAQFCFYVERLVNGGVPLLEGLSDVRDSVANPALRNVVGVLIQDIESGSTMSQALKQHPKVFDEVFISLVEAGEQSGELDVVLHNIGENIKWQDDIVKKTKKALRYPIFGLIVIIGATAMLMKFVVPDLVKLLKSFGEETLPFYTEWLIATSDFFAGQWYLAFAVIFGIWMAFKVAMKTVPGIDYFMDKMSIRIPIFGTVFEKLLMSRFANVFGLLYGAGVSVIDGLKIARGALGNKFVAKGLDGVIDSIAGGTSLSDSFRESGLFPPLVLRMIRLGETTGGVDQAMMQIKGYYDRDANEAIETAQGAIQPIIMLILAILLVWVIVAIYGPLYDALTKVN